MVKYKNDKIKELSKLRIAKDFCATRQKIKEKDAPYNMLHVLFEATGIFFLRLCREIKLPAEAETVANKLNTKPRR